MTQRMNRQIALVQAEAFGPPSSPPMTNLLPIKIMKQQTDVIRKSMTEKAKSPAGT
jgi:hypothetical protein